MPSPLPTTTDGPSYSCYHSRLNTYRGIMKHQSFTFLFIYLSINILFIYLYIMYLFGCIGSQLWHMGSSSHCADLSLQGTDSLVVVLELSSCNMWAQLLRGMWDWSLPTRNQTPSPALRGRFLPTGLPGKSLLYFPNILPVLNHSWPHNTKNRPC